MKIIENLCQQRDLKQRIANNRNRLFRMAFSWTHNRDLAADLTQETMLKALRALGKLRDPAALDSWLFGILSNCMRDHYRRQKETIDIDEVELKHSETPEKLNHKLDLVDSVRRSIAMLNEAQRHVVTLVDLEGFSYAEVATILEIPVGTVMSRLSRARQQLAHSLLDYKTDQTRSETDIKLRRVK